MKKKIFISHSSLDKSIIESFINNVLILGLEIPSEDIFCSSLEGHGIQSGKYIPQTIRDELTKSKISFLMISGNYRNSEVCQNELGASWVLLPEEKVIPIIIDSRNYNELGFLSTNKLSLKSTDLQALIKMINDNKSDLNANINFERLNKNLNTFVKEQEKTLSLNKEPSDYQKCFSISLRPFAEISQKNLPEYQNELYNTDDENQINTILKSLSGYDFKNQLMFLYGGGDCDFEKMSRLKNGNWLISSYELKVTELWFNINDSIHQEFILLKTEALPPFTTDSNNLDAYEVGVMNDGTIISMKEYSNGFAKINGEIVEIDKNESNARYRHNYLQWFFIATRYHNVMCNYDASSDFIQRLNNGEIELSEQTIRELNKTLRLHPTVLNNR